MKTPQRQNRLKATLCGMLLLAAPAVTAQQALVIANFDYVDAPASSDLRAGALVLSEALFGLGYTVTRLENPDPRRVDEAISGLAASPDPVLIYYAGRSRAEDDRSLLIPTRSGAPYVLDDMLSAVGAGTRATTLVFLDVCNDVAVADDAPALGAFPAYDGLLVASSVAAGVSCTATDTILTNVLLERLEVAGLSVAELFAPADVAVQSTLAQPFVLHRADNGMRLTAEDYKMLDRLSPEAQAQMLALWAAAGIVLDRADVQPQQQAPAVTPTPQPAPQPTITTQAATPTPPVQRITDGGVRLVPVQPTAPRVRDQVTLTAGTTPVTSLAAPAPTLTSTSRPVPGTGGLPQPSIIVGLIAPTEASFGTVEEATGPVAGSSIAYTDIEGRRRLREQDPGGFAVLLAAGAFDPPPEELIVALQTELARMGCYTSTIDGQWGPGSRASVGRYYEQIDGASPSQNADIAIFRQIALRDDVTCTIAAAPAPTRQAPAAPRPAAPAAPAEPAATGGNTRTINQTTGTGVFR